MRQNFRGSKRFVTGRVICWSCGGSDKQLFRVIDKNGNKTQDYICGRCMSLGKIQPPIGNVSIMRFKTQKSPTNVK